LLLKVLELSAFETLPVVWAVDICGAIANAAARDMAISFIRFFILPGPLLVGWPLMPPQNGASGAKFRLSDVFTSFGFQLG
jgi:hypothetical protein